MPICQNCGNIVSRRFARVMSGSEDTVKACPDCEDRTLSDGRVKEYRG